MVAGLICGCSGDDPPELELQIPPESISLSEVAWQRRPAFSPDDQDRLVAHFHTNRSLAENPLLEGEPVVYSADGDRIRYYWFTETGSDIHWMFLEFRAGAFTELGEGTGDSFATNAH